MEEFDGCSKKDDALKVRSVMASDLVKVPKRLGQLREEG